MVTTVPTEPLVGEKLVICGITRNILLLFSVPLEVVTVTGPVIAVRNSSRQVGASYSLRGWCWGSVEGHGAWRNQANRTHGRVLSVVAMLRQSYLALLR